MKIQIERSLQGLANSLEGVCHADSGLWVWWWRSSADFGQSEKKKKKKKSKRKGSWVSVANPLPPHPPRSWINYKCTYQMIMKIMRWLAWNCLHLWHPDHSIKVFALWEVGSFDFEGIYKYVKWTAGSRRFSLICSRWCEDSAGHILLLYLVGGLWWMNVLTAREIDIYKWDLSAFVESCEITYLPLESWIVR